MLGVLAELYLTQFNASTRGGRRDGGPEFALETRANLAAAGGRNIARGSAAGCPCKYLSNVLEVLLELNQSVVGLDHFATDSRRNLIEVLEGRGEGATRFRTGPTQLSSRGGSGTCSLGVPTNVLQAKLLAAVAPDTKVTNQVHNVTYGTRTAPNERYAMITAEFRGTVPGVEP